MEITVHLVKIQTSPAKTTRENVSTCEDHYKGLKCVI